MIKKNEHTPAQTTLVMVVWAYFRATPSCWRQDVGVVGSDSLTDG